MALDKDGVWRGVREMDGRIKGMNDVGQEWMFGVG